MSLRINIVFLIAFIACLASCSKDPKVEGDQESKFVKLFGGSVDDIGKSLVECSDGGFAITGTMLNPDNTPQAFLIRTDKFGNEFSWSPVFIGNTLSTRAKSLLLTSDGNFLVTGSVKTVAGDSDVMVSKISAQGSILWYKTFGGSADDEGFCATEIESGSYIIGGYSESDPSFGGKDLFVLNLTKDGDLVWQKNYGGPQDEVCNQILKLGRDLVLLGTTYSYQTTNDIPNIYLVTIDPNNPLTPLGGQNYGGTSKIKGIKGFISGTNNIMVIGNKQIGDSSKIFMLSLQDDIYTEVWEKNISSNQNECANDLLFQNNQYITLGCSGFSPNLDFLIQPLSLNGSPLPLITITSSGTQVIFSGIISKDNHLVYTGQNSINGISKIVLVKTNLP